MKAFDQTEQHHQSHISAETSCLPSTALRANTSPVEVTSKFVGLPLSEMLTQAASPWILIKASTNVKGLYVSYQNRHEQCSD
jgi:hypothetical protein